MAALELKIEGGVDGATLREEPVGIIIGHDDIRKSGLEKFGVGGDTGLALGLGDQLFRHPRPDHQGATALEKSLFFRDGERSPKAMNSKDGFRRRGSLPTANRTVAFHRD